MLAPKKPEPNLHPQSVAPAEPVKTIRVLDFMETLWLSGPAKNLIAFARRAMEPNASSARVEIAVVVFHRGGAPLSNDFTLACREAGLRLHVIHERFAFDPAVVSAIRRLVRTEKPDIVQTHSVKSHFLTRLTGIHKQCPWIAFHHGYTWTDLKVLVYNQLDRWSLPASARVVTVCRPFGAALQRLGIAKERIAIQHNAVNRFVPATEEAVNTLREDLGISRDTRVLLNVGRLSREKGQADLIKALPSLRNDHGERNLRLLLVGDGPDRPRLERLASASGVRDLVTFVGHQTDVTPYYTLANLMVLPSGTEGSPNALLEAMAAGLPIVATAVGGVPEIVLGTDAAILVQKNDPAALARAIAKILDSQQLQSQLSSAARKTASLYSRQAYCDFLVSLYQDCLKQTGTLQEAGATGRSETPLENIQKKIAVTG